jgi:hypothetical protein
MKLKSRADKPGIGGIIFDEHYRDGSALESLAAGFFTAGA